MARRHTTQTAVRSTSTDMAPAAPVTLQLSAKLETVIDNLRRPFKAFVSQFKEMTVSRAELAPLFVQAYTAFEKETEGSFIQFCRLVDPTIPPDRASYRNDSGYQAATYLRRLVQQAQAAPTRKRGPKPATPLVALARFVATVLPVVDPTGAIWSAFVAEMHWSERQAQRVQALGVKTGPIAIPRKVQSILEHKRAAA